MPSTITTMKLDNNLVLFLSLLYGLTQSFEEIQGPTFILEPPSSVDFSNNTGTSIDCLARGNPSPTIKWVLVDGKQVQDVRNVRTVLDNGTLVFPPFRTSEYQQDVHSAIYRCHASNSVGSIVSRDVRIRAVVMQVYEAQVYDEFVIRGNTAVMRCHIPSFVADYVTVTKWVVDGTSHIQTPGESGSKYSILSSGELYIRDVAKIDGNRDYQCLTTHRLTKETRQSATAGQLFVTDPQGSVPPRITGSKATIHVERGKTAAIPCAAQGYPVPSYSWLKKVNKAQIMPVTGSERIQPLGGMLLIRDAQNYDATTYICVVNNSVGVERVETTVVVTAPLEVEIDPRVQTVDIGKSATMKCVISGFPVTSVSWLKDGQPIPSDRTRLEQVDLLRLIAVQKGDAGMYQCLVRNEEETAQGTSELGLGDALPEIHQTFEDQVLQPGASINLRCIASGNPPPQITWTLDDGALPQSRRFEVGSFVMANGDVVGHVNLSSVRSEDGGDYGCIATNRVGSVKKTGRLNIYGYPYIRPMRKVSIVAGDRLILKCPVTGFPIASIIWEKEGTVLPVDYRQEVFPNGTMIVQNVQRTADTGKYTCIATAPDGRSARRDVEVSVMVSPKIVPFTFQDTVMREGTRARLQCVVSEGDVPLSIAWTKDGHPIPHGLGVVVRDLDEFSSILNINSVSPRQNGRYTCTVSNEAASVNHSAVLLVNVSPRWIVHPQDADVLVGGGVQLDCQADGFPKPTITWMKVVEGSGHRQSIQNSVHYQVLNNGSLRLLSADENDRGHYFCLANNGIGAGLSRMVHLNVRVPVKFDVSYRHQTIKRGSDAALICQVRGDPPVQLTWQVNNRVIDYSEELRFAIKETPLKTGLISELRIMHVERQDTATFACFARNMYGQDETSIHLLVLEIPDAPKMPKILDQTSRSFRLSWSQPYDGNSPINRYIIQYKSFSDDWNDGSLNVTVEGMESTATVSGLLPATGYHARIFAENEVGLSDPSEVVQLTTEEEAPSGPPMDIKVQATGSSSVLVTWKSPKRSSWNGELLGYNVGYRIYDSTDAFTFRKVDISGDLEQDTSLELTGLRKFTKYGVVIRAYNRVGPGSNSDEIVEQTAEDVPTLPPEETECVALSSQSLQIAWQPPPPNDIHGILQGYKVVYKPMEEWYDGIEPEIKITSATKTIIHGLQRYSNYSVQVLAFTRVGDGVISPPIYCITMEDVPDPPADIKALPLSPNSILVVWKSPINKNGVISKYSVYMRSLETGKEDTIKNLVESSQTDYEFTGMVENVRYEFWVTASTSVGEGQSTHVISLILTPPPVPAKIAAFHEQLVTALGSDLTLSCRAIGIPLPEREWRTRGHMVEKNERFQWLPDGSLFIRDIQNYDDGNYTCHVWNSHGADEVTYVVIVQVPPSPPNVSVHEVTSDSMSLRWESARNGGMPILGYTIHFKREYGEWEEVSVAADHHTYSLYNLECGTRYLVYVTAKNRIGIGDASQTLNLRTEGTAPTLPQKEKLIDVSATFVTLNLDAWRDSGACPILYFVVEHQPRGASTWTLVSNNVQPQQHRQFIIPDLQPASRYRLKMTAHNSAGSSVAEYDFATLTLSGVTLASEPALNESTKPWDVKVVASVAGSSIVLAIVIALLCLLNRRNSRDRSKKDPVRIEQYEKAATEPISKPYTMNNSTSGSFTYLLGNHDRPRTHITSDFEKKGTHDDICPYATFQVAETQQTTIPGEELKTFSQRRNAEIEELYSKVRKSAPIDRPRIHYAYPKVQEYESPDDEHCESSELTPMTEQCLQLRAREQCSDGLCDHHVPDLLDHNLESGSSNEQSPILEKPANYMTEMGRNRNANHTPHRHHRPNSRYYEGQSPTKEATLIYEDGLDVYLSYYNGQHQYPEGECSTERPYRPK